MAKPFENSGVVNFIGVGTISLVRFLPLAIFVLVRFPAPLTPKERLFVGSTGMVEGNVDASNADVSGELKSSISVSELFRLKIYRQTRRRHCGQQISH